MKSVCALFAVLALAGTTQAKTIICYDSYDQTQGPVVQATLVSNTTLKNISFHADNHEELSDDHGVVMGTMIVSHHSPYFGDIQYAMPNGVRLILPSDLSSDNLSALKISGGIGFEKGENGVVIGESKEGGDGAGNHFSIRLDCTLNK